MNHIILDLEATCFFVPRGSETIEIGAVKLNDKMKVIGSFHSFVKPILHPTLHKRCQKLTTIMQSDVDRASIFPSVLAELQEWMGLNYWIYTWGGEDKIQLKRDCSVYHLSNRWLYRHFDLNKNFVIMLKNQRKFRKEFKDKDVVGLKRALTILNLPFDGNQHRALTDAANTAKVFQNIYPFLKRRLSVPRPKTPMETLINQRVELEERIKYCKGLQLSGAPSPCISEINSSVNNLLASLIHKDEHKLEILDKYLWQGEHWKAPSPEEMMQWLQCAAGLE